MLNYYFFAALITRVCIFDWISILSVELMYGMIPVMHVVYCVLMLNVYLYYNAVKMSEICFEYMFMCV